MIQLSLKYTLLFLIVFIVSCDAEESSRISNNYTQYVDPLSGTKRPGQTIPSVGIPFGMTQWTPQTQFTERHAIPPYKHDEEFFCGIRGTHWLSGSAVKDYGSFSIMPIMGKLKTGRNEIRLPYSSVNEVFDPDYYRAELDEYGISAEVTASARCGMIRLTAERADSLFILTFPNNDQGNGLVKVDVKNNEIVGYNPAVRAYAGWGNPAGINGYFVVRPDRKIQIKGTFNGSVQFPSDSIMSQKNIGAYIGFSVKQGEEIVLRAGTSFTSIEQARNNLDAEIKRIKFGELREKAASEWEQALGKIKVTTEDTVSLNIFYTAMYHSMQQPRLFSDVDGSYPRFSRQYDNGKLGKREEYYDDFSMWDIYRAHLPLFEILDPEMTNKWIQSMLIKGNDGGWLPIFPCWNSYTSEMIGDHVISYIASAYLKGIRDYDIQGAYSLMRQNAFEIPRSEEDYIDGRGRRGLMSYLQYGYIPLEDKVDEAPNPHKEAQVSRTIEYAYDDYALAQMARALGKQSDYEKLIKRSNNYRNVFDSNLNMVRGRYADGTWSEPFQPDYMHYKYITEGSPRQYTFYVPHDVPGLARLMGGRDSLETALDSAFTDNRHWHGNEPGHQTPFLYNYTASPWKTQKKVREILLSEYDVGPTGLSGNDDGGQMSAWYIFAATGFYPVNPVSGEYLLSSPLFEKVSIQLPDNLTMDIICHKDTSEAIYIRSVKLNGKEFPRNFITYKELMEGGILEFFLTDKPGSWGSTEESQPSGLIVCYE